MTDPCKSIKEEEGASSYKESNDLWSQRLLDPSPIERFLQSHQDITRESTTRLTSGRYKLVGVSALPDYTSIRRQQNQNWADARLQEGIALARANEYRRAHQAYQQGLDLIPNHVELLVASAANQANQGHKQQAMAMLEQALHIEPDHGNAKQYLQEIQQSLRQSALAEKAERARTDALVERSLRGNEALSDSNLSHRPTGERVSVARYELLPLSDDEVRKKSKKKKRRKRRRYNDADSTDESSATREHRKKNTRKRRKEHRKRKRREEYDDDSNATCDSLVLLRDQQLRKGQGESSERGSNRRRRADDAEGRKLNNGSET